MSVTLTAVSWGEIQISNGEWAALCAMAQAFGIEGAQWNGNHDGTFYSPETLTKMADRAKQIGEAEGYLREASKNGGVTLS